VSCVLGFDIGTTSTIGILLRLPDRVLALASRPVELSSPHPGWAEENPLQWWDNVCTISRELLQRGGIEASEIEAVGVTGMTPAVVLLDANGQLLRPSIQQSDGRCGAEVAQLRRECDEAAFLAQSRRLRNFRRRTGAFDWRMYEDEAISRRYLETYLVGSWEEHERQHARATRRDAALLESLDAALVPGTQRLAHHYLAASKVKR